MLVEGWSNEAIDSAQRTQHSTAAEVLLELNYKIAPDAVLRALKAFSVAFDYFNLCRKPSEEQHEPSGNEVLSSVAFEAFFAGVHVALDHPNLHRDITDIATVLRDLQKSQDARETANKKHADDPKQAAKKSVKECWELWQKKPERYAKKSVFAKDMLEKYTSLESQKVIEDWCRSWEKETKGM